MLLRIFKGNNPGVIILIALIAILLWFRTFIHPGSYMPFNPDLEPVPLFLLLVKITGGSLIAGQAVSFILMGLIALLLVNFNTSSFFINERTYLPALLYVLAGGYFPEYQSLNPALPAALFLMLAFMRIVEGYRKPGLANEFFDGSLLISTGSLFYASLIWFWLLIIIGIIIIRTFNFSEVLIAVIGLVTPYLMAFGIYYILGKDLGALASTITANLFAGTGSVHFSALTIVAMSVSSVILLISLIFLFGIINSKKIKARNTFSLLIWTFLISVAVYFILPAASAEMIWIAAIPVSYFLSHYFVFVRKKLMPEIYFSLIFLSVLVIQIFGQR